ncbi:MAG: GNAT family N-acetyltransferase [Flavobacterium sp.]|nr:MAG: GNAT family N-acetyltransferase [Flavobacterium sp.]
MLHFKRAESPSELDRILQLQKRNLPVSLSSEVKKTEGFVTVEHDFELLERMNNACPHFIAVHDKEVIGYALSMHPKFGQEIPILRPMFSEIKKRYTKSDFIVMGQICIDTKFRKQGIFRRLYKEMLKGIRPEFDCIITEVDSNNTRSMDAHYAIGFKKISTYIADGHSWDLMLLR